MFQRDLFDISSKLGGIRNNSIIGNLISGKPEHITKHRSINMKKGKNLQKGYQKIDLEVKILLIQLEKLREDHCRESKASERISKKF
jgi:hypothetical protein